MICFVWKHENWWRNRSVRKKKERRSTCQKSKIHFLAMNAIGIASTVSTNAKETIVCQTHDSARKVTIYSIYSRLFLDLICLLLLFFRLRWWIDWKSVNLRMMHIRFHKIRFIIVRWNKVYAVNITNECFAIGRRESARFVPHSPNENEPTKSSTQ